jgi:hypothetical protein
MATAELLLVPGVDGAGGFHGLGQAAAHWAEDEGGDVALRREGQIGALGRKLDAAVEAEAGFAEEFGGKAHVFRAVDAPEPQFLFVALQEIDGFLELLHGLVEAGGQVKDAEEPGVAGVADADAHAILPGLIALDGAAVIVADRRRTGWHGAHQSLKVLALGGHLIFLLPIPSEPLWKQLDRLATASDGIRVSSTQIG